MTTEQEQKLKAFLAGRLETEIGIYPDGNLYWVESGNYVLDTELLEICHRIEMGLSHADWLKWISIAQQVMGMPSSGTVCIETLIRLQRMDWQEKALSLAELFGEEI